MIPISVDNYARFTLQLTASSSYMTTIR